MPHTFKSLFSEIMTNSRSNSIVAAIYRSHFPSLANQDIFATTLLNIMNKIITEKKQALYSHG